MIKNEQDEKNSVVDDSKNKPKDALSASLTIYNDHPRVLIHPKAFEISENNNKTTNNKSNVSSSSRYSSIRHIPRHLKKKQFENLLIAGPITETLKEARKEESGIEREFGDSDDEEKNNVLNENPKIILRNKLMENIKACLDILFRELRSEDLLHAIKLQQRLVEETPKESGMKSGDTVAKCKDEDVNNDGKKKQHNPEQSKIIPDSNAYKISPRIKKAFKDLKSFMMKYHDKQLNNIVVKKDEMNLDKYLSYAHVMKDMKSKNCKIKIDDTEINSCQRVKSVAKYLSEKLSKPIATKKRKYVPVVGTRIIQGRGSSYKDTYYHDAIPYPILPPNPLSSSYITLKDNFYKEDENVLRFIPYFSDNDLDEVVDVNAYDVVPGEGLKPIEHEVDDYLSVLTTFGVARVLQHHQYALNKYNAKPSHDSEKERK